MVECFGDRNEDGDTFLHHLKPGCVTKMYVFLIY